MGWPLPDGMADSELEAKLLGGSTEGAAPVRGVPLWPQIHEQLRRKGVTLRLLWQEYRQAHPNGFQYSRCCDLYREWTGALEPVLRLPHEPGRHCGRLLSEKCSPSEILLAITRFDRATRRRKVQTKIRAGLRRFAQVT